MIEKWIDFGDKTTNLLKYAVFEINDLRCVEGGFRRNWVRCIPQRKMNVWGIVMFTANFANARGFPCGDGITAHL